MECANIGGQNLCQWLKQSRVMPYRKEAVIVDIVKIKNSGHCYERSKKDRQVMLALGC